MAAGKKLMVGGMCSSGEETGTQSYLHTGPEEGMVEGSGGQVDVGGVEGQWEWPNRTEIELTEGWRIPQASHSATNIRVIRIMKLKVLLQYCLSVTRLLARFQ